MTHGFLRCQQSHPARFESWFCFGRNCPYCSRRGRKFNAVVPLLVPLKRIKLFETKTPKSPIKVLKPRTGLFCFCLFCFAKQARTRGKPHFCPRFAVLFVYPPPRSRESKKLTAPWNIVKVPPRVGGVKTREIPPWVLRPIPD